MNSLYQSYIKAFNKFAQSALRNNVVRSITKFALLINWKANELLQRAILNNLKDLPSFQKEIFESGKEYVRRFSSMRKGKNS